MRSMFSALPVVLLAVIGLLLSGPGTSAAAGWRYTMVGFSNASDLYMDVYQSSNGTDFTPLAKPAYVRRPGACVTRASSATPTASTT